MKKLINLLVFIILGAVLVGCTPATNINKTFSNDKNFFGFSALTSAIALGDNSQSLLSTSESSSLINLSTDVNTEVDMEKVNSYLQMMEMMFTDNGPILLSEEASDREEYETKLNFSAKDLAGNVTAYTLYINQELLNDEVHSDHEEDDDHEENEQEYRLTGIAVINDVEYEIKGKKEIENNEFEMEIKITLDSDNYVVISQESEDNELEYEYLIFKDGKKFSKLEFEVEDGKEIELEFRTTENGYRETYHFKKENNEIKIKYSTDTTSYTIKAKASVDPETGETVYTYKVKETNKEFKYKD